LEVHQAAYENQLDEETACAKEELEEGNVHANRTPNRWEDYSGPVWMAYGRIGLWDESVC
jgi:hypothetical protein